MFVVVGELRFDVVGAAGQHPFGRLLDWGDELVLLLGSGAVAPHHVVRFVNCGFKKKEKKWRKLNCRWDEILINANI